MPLHWFTSKDVNATDIGDGTSKPDDRLVIAVDFGTTFSGIAYCMPSLGNLIPEAITNWPGAEGSHVPKIPSVIRYDKNDLTKFEWGASVGQHSDNVVAIKLLLDPTQRRPHYLPTQNFPRNTKALPKPPVEMAADFLGAIYRHALKEISGKFPKTHLDQCRKDFVLTVPALWSDAAKQATLQAARVAGIHPVRLVKEPEAGGLYTAKSLGLALKCNDVFIVCDAGGGTVDVVSYLIEAVRPGLRARELVPGTGGMAGSLGLNHLFANAVANLVGDEEWYGLKKSEAWLHAEKQFDEKVKIEYRGSKDMVHYVTFPRAGLTDDPENNLISDCWGMTSGDLEGIFDPIVRSNLELLERQVEALRHKRGEQSVITGIFLVGGFGGSLYLKDRVLKRFPDIQVLQSDDAWAAIAKGAVLSMIPRVAIVTSTCATRHYGVEAGIEHDPHIDAGQPTYVNCDGITRTSRMDWYIKIGDTLSRDMRIKFPYRRFFAQDCDANDFIFINKLYQCDDKKAPVHRSKGERIQRNCTLVSDLSGVPKSKFVRKTGKNGNRYWKVEYDLVVTLQTAVMKFSLEIDGTEMGSLNVNYD